MQSVPKHLLLLDKPETGKQFRYDVFISYRHCEPDTKWANWLVRALETYKPPRSVSSVLRNEGRPVRISRVFRDEDESSAGGDLTEALKEALRESRNLVVICSRNTPRSPWIDDEIRYFSSLGRSSRILPLLVEGNPEESFPVSLGARQDGFEPGGSGESNGEVEPLAADVRPRENVSAREAKRRALLKVIAGALDVRYDALYQRDLRRRRRRWILGGSALGLIVSSTLGWIAWTRTDAYQVQRAYAQAPGLLPSVLGDDVASWCRALAVTGHFDEAVRVAEAADTFGGDRVKALIATAEAALEINRDSDFEALMTEAAAASELYKPAFSMQMRREVAKAFVRCGRSMYARSFIAKAVAASEAVTGIGERVAHLRKFAELLREVEGSAYVSKLSNYDDRVFLAVATVVGAEAAATEGSSDEATRLAAEALAFAGGSNASHRPYLWAWVLEASAAAGLTISDPGVADQALRLAQQMPAGPAKSVALRQIAVAMSRLGRADDANPILNTILDEGERQTASEAVARAFARNGKAAPALDIVDTYKEDDLDRYSIVSGIGEGLGDRLDWSILKEFDRVLPHSEKLEIRLIAAEALRKAGKADEAQKLLTDILRMAQSASGEAEPDEIASRIVTELLAGGRSEEALTVARQAADPHDKAFSLLPIAKWSLSQKRMTDMRNLLTEAIAAEEQVSDADLRAAGYREIGRVFQAAGDAGNAAGLFRRALTEVTKGGKYGSSTVADLAEEFSAMGQLPLARSVADRYCEEGDRLRVYTALVLRHFGRPTRKLPFED